ncbi:MAG: hypothetical protein ACI4OZ_08935 [Akkermansia sp.]
MASSKRVCARIPGLPWQEKAAEKGPETHKKGAKTKKRLAKSGKSAKIAHPFMRRITCTSGELSGAPPENWQVSLKVRGGMYKTASARQTQTQRKHADH